MTTRYREFRFGRVSSTAWAASILALVIFMAATVDLRTLALDPAQRVALTTGIASEENGLFGRRIALPALALIGLLALVFGRRRTLRVKGVPGVLMTVALLLSCASVGWAMDSRLAARKIAVLLCMWIGALWSATAIRTDEFPTVAFTTMTAVVLGCVGWDLLNGHFHPFAANYRFGGLFHPNTTGRYLSIALVAGLLVLPRMTGLRRVPFAALLGCLGLIDFKTGSRTSVLSLGVGASVCALLAAALSRRWRWLLMCLGVGLLACVTAFVLAGGNVPHVGGAFLHMGRTGADLSTLTGRVPAWHELLSRYVAARPYFGYGYNAFWTPDHIVSMASVVPGIAFFHAHSGYIDLLLSVGYVGAALYLLAFIASTAVLVRRYLRSPDSGLAFMVALLAMLLTGMLTESLNFNVSLPAFFTLIALANAGYVRQYQTQSPSYPPA